MHNGGVLGDEGRKALNACVKVKIYGKPETRKYDFTTAAKRLNGCYAGELPAGSYASCSLPVKLDERGRMIERTYDIVDIHDALVNFDEKICVEKYPTEGPGSDKLKDLIEKRRADIERELEEATADPNRRHRYSWVVAQRRVRDCFAGNFAEDRWLVLRSGGKPLDIIEIYHDVSRWDKATKKASEKRATLEKEYAEAAAAVEENVKHTLRRYHHEEVVKRLCACYYESIPFNEVRDSGVVPVEIDKNGHRNFNSDYDIFDIHKAFLQLNGKKLLQKYPEEGPGSEELKKLIDEHRDNLKEEYQKATCDTGGEPRLREYSASEAERRVRDCFAGAHLRDTDILATVKKDGNDGDQTYDIFDIKQAVDHFDIKTFVDAFKYPKGGQKCGEKKQMVDEQRADIQEEYELATSCTEIEHGSGFIVHNHFIITNRHVIETYLNETESHEIRISNAAIGELACTVAYYDAGKDLALLFCPDLNLEQSGICPLQLSSQSLLPGMSIFSFGYPMSHTEETALFVSGNVSGSKKTLAGHSMVVLNCSLNSGNSGGPVLCWVNGQLKVAGVATQKHLKQILTLEERKIIEKIRNSLQTHAIPDVPDDHLVKRSEASLFQTDYFLELHPVCQTSMSLLTLKLYDALETHSQFNLSNALPGHLVNKFIKNAISECTGVYKEELAEMLK
ncbi:uncharacterized protein LOC144649251 [Oculina patagonica]